MSKALIKWMTHYIHYTDMKVLYNRKLDMTYFVVQSLSQSECTRYMTPSDVSMNFFLSEPIDLHYKSRSNSFGPEDENEFLRCQDSLSAVEDCKKQRSTRLQLKKKKKDARP